MGFYCMIKLQENLLKAVDICRYGFVGNTWYIIMTCITCNKNFDGIFKRHK